MLLSSIFSLLLSNALSFRRDTAILYSRIGIIVLLYCIYLSYNNLFITYLNNSIRLKKILIKLDYTSLKYKIDTY